MENPSDKSDQGTKSKDLLTIISKLKAYPGGDFHAPFTKSS